MIIEGCHLPLLPRRRRSMGGCFGLPGGAVPHAIQRDLQVTMNLRAVHKAAGGNIGVSAREGVDPFLRRCAVGLIVHTGTVGSQAGLPYGSNQPNRSNRLKKPLRRGRSGTASA
jgi:hypothetical protein